VSNVSRVSKSLTIAVHPHLLERFDVQCSQCQNSEFKVLETRASGGGIRRRRQCLACDHRFTTHERIERKLPLVVKKDKSRTPFDRDKVIAGLHLACRKRPVSAARLDEAVNQIEGDLLHSGAGEVTTDQIGKTVLRALQDIDPVAYLRFSSVYLDVSSPSEFQALLQPWLDKAEQS